MSRRSRRIATTTTTITASSSLFSLHTISFLCCCCCCLLSTVSIHPYLPPAAAGAILLGGHYSWSMILSTIQRIGRSSASFQHYHRYPTARRSVQQDYSSTISSGRTSIVSSPNKRTRKTLPTTTTTTSTTTTTRTTRTRMSSWAETWDDIVNGGSLRWKVTDPKLHTIALSHLEKYMAGTTTNTDSTATITKGSILCPLAGDDPMVYLLWQRGYSVTAIDLVPVALERIRTQFSSSDSISTNNNDDDAGGEWTMSTTTSTSASNTVVWTHSSGRAVQYVGDAVQARPELDSMFDAVYDKDSFGALPISVRQSYCIRLAQYMKPGAILYMEVRYRDDHEQVKDVVGPPFSLTKDDIMDDAYFGTDFEYIANLGPLYPDDAAGSALPVIKQTGHILQRKKYHLKQQEFTNRMSKIEDFSPHNARRGYARTN